jgi:hypothetical protein
VNNYIPVLEQGFDMSQPGGLPGVTHHDCMNTLWIDILHGVEVEKIGGTLNEKVAQALFLGTGKDQNSLGIELLGRNHGRQAVKICVGVCGYDNWGLDFGAHELRTVDLGWKRWWISRSREILT